MADSREWKDLSSSEKRNAKVGLIIVGLILIVVFVFFSYNNTSVESPQSENNASQTSKVDEDKSPQQILLEKLDALIASGQAFDTGSYVKNDIPTGDYAFVPYDGSGKYYSEEDQANNIIDNENFDSFGYVHVHSAGNLETQGLLIKMSSLSKLDSKGAKAAYEALNSVESYTGAGMYKVGTDISAGSHTLKSYGEGYVEVMSGPVGNSEIIDNEIFSGKYTVNLQPGQYLKVSRAEILQ